MKKGQKSRGIFLDFCPETVTSVVRIHKAPQADHGKCTAKICLKNDCIERKNNSEIAAPAAVKSKAGAFGEILGLRPRVK